ncbi:hypothetical protein ACFZBU_36560 [Embleya sp. NPDC008237]|uniref:hypothetical protein n=1 Tax=Embleya sp. NPDC008237 TaxID=3363978 RepID=UPI0036E83BD6
MTTDEDRAAGDECSERLAAVRAILNPPRLFETTGDLARVSAQLPADTPLWADEITRSEPGSEDDWALVVTADTTVMWSPVGPEDAPQRLADPEPTVVIGARYVHRANLAGPLTSVPPRPSNW